MNILPGKSCHVWKYKFRSFSKIIGSKNNIALSPGSQLVFFFYSVSGSGSGFHCLKET